MYLAIWDSRFSDITDIVRDNIIIYVKLMYIANNIREFSIVVQINRNICLHNKLFLLI